jgi:hypothetical protein
MALMPDVGSDTATLIWLLCAGEYSSTHRDSANLVNRWEPSLARRCLRRNLALGVAQ